MGRVRAPDLRRGATVDVSSSGQSGTRARVFDTTATFIHRVDGQEDRRRRRCGAGALGSLELLDALLELPAYASVPLASLTALTVRVLRAAPPGTVAFTEGAVVRLAVPVITQVVAVVCTAPGPVTAAGFRDGLERASRFAAYCPRLLLTPALPPQLDVVALLVEADWYGIGVAAGSASAATVLVEPEPIVDWTPTPAWWVFSETIYQHVSRGRSTTRRSTSSARRGPGEQPVV